MRAASLLLLASLVPACGSSDPCAGVSGTCLTVTVTSSAVAQVDSVDLTASGAISGTHSSAAGGAQSLPIQVGLSLPASVQGSLTLTVDGRLAGAIVGSGSASTQVTPGMHAGITVDIEPGAGGGDMAVPGDGGGDLAMPDLKPVCDPHGIAGPACVWRWQTPLPQGEDVIGLASFSDSDSFGYTGGNTVMHRDATGWTLLPAAPKPAIGFLRPRTMTGTSNINGTDLFVLGFNTGTGTPSEVFHSTDKGGSWTEETLPAQGNPAPFTFGMASNGTAAIIPTDDGHVYMRSSSTGTWSASAQIGSASTTHFHGAYMGTVVNLAVGYDSTGGMVAHNAPGTTTWTLVDNIPGANTVGSSFEGACGATAGGGFRYWAVGNVGVSTALIFTSTDGATWTAQTPNVSQILYGCYAADGNNVWAWGQNGALVHTSNGGTTWTAQTSGATVPLVAGAGSPQGLLLVGGTQGTLIRSHDSGATWTSEVSGPTGNWQGLAEVAPQTLYAVGTGGSIARTTDGYTWTGVTSPTTNVLIAVWGSSATDIYAVGANGTVLHSDGTTFTKYTNPASGGIPAGATVNDVAGLASDNVFVATSSGLFRSTDHGASWNPVTLTGLTGGPAVLSVFAMGTDIWAGANSGQVWHSTDGVSWTAQPIPGPIGNQDVTRMRGHAPNVLYAISANAGLLSRSTNGGTSWTTLVPSSGNPFGGGGFNLAVTPTGNYLYVAGFAGLIVSQDDGMNWAPVTTGITGSSSNGLAILARADNDVYVTAGPGVIHYGN